MAPRALRHTPSHASLVAAGLLAPTTEPLPRVDPLDAARAAMFAEPPSLARRLVAAIPLPGTLRPLVARLVALALALVAPLGPGLAVATLISAALALWCPVRPLLAALGAAAVAEAAVAWFADAPAASDAVVLAGQLVLGAIAIRIGVGARASVATAGDATAAAMHGRTIAATGILAVLAAGVATSLGLLLGAVPAGEWVDMLAGTSLTTPAVGLLAATATALVARRGRSVPLAWTAAGALLLAVASALGGAAIVGARVDGAVAWHDVTATVVARHALPVGSMRVLVSPSGQRWAVQRAVARGTPVAGALSDGWDWDLGSLAEGRTRTVRALALAFLDDTRVVALARRGDSLEVRLEPAFAGEDPLPRRPTGIPAMLDPALRVDRASGTWHVAGRPRPRLTGRFPADRAVDGIFEDEEDSPIAALAEVALIADASARRDTMVVAGGRVGSGHATVRRWVLPALATVALPLADGGVLYHEAPRFDDASPWRLLVGAMPRGTLWRLGADGARTRVASMDPVQCGGASPRGDALCVERGIRRLRGLVVDGGGRVTGRVTLRSGLMPLTRAAGTQLAVTACDRHDVALLDAARRRGTRAMLGERACIVDATPTPHGFAGIRANAGGMELVSWRMPR